jgi:hypothetical protein
MVKWFTLDHLKQHFKVLDNFLIINYLCSQCTFSYASTKNMVTPSVHMAKHIQVIKKFI